jgi:two-component system cell cycle response regulator CpdR
MIDDKTGGANMARILIAEDDDSLRQFLAKALTSAGHDVDSAGDGIEAEAAVSTFEYDLLIADIVMPGLDGIELARRACATRRELRVMFITGFAAVALKAREMAPRQDARVLSKPFHLRDLVAEVDRLLAA